MKSTKWLREFHGTLAELRLSLVICLAKDKTYREEYDCCRQAVSGRDRDCVGIITDIIGLSGKRMYQCVKNWDYIDFINRA